jgi:hypothetical protein
MTVEALYIMYALASAWEIYLFLMQRATLDLSRANNIDPKLARQMLPLWYTTVWPTKVARWILLFLTWRAEGWMALIVAWALVMLATSLLPVPYRHFFPMFRRKLSRDMTTEYASTAAQLMVALLKAETQLAGW